MSHPKWTLLPSHVYVTDLVDAIDRATDRVYMIALVITEDTITMPLITALEHAAQRGVSVEIGMDIFFTYRELGYQQSRWRYLKNQQQSMRNMKRRLEKAGAKVRWLGEFGITFFSRRTHSKWCIVDDTIYSFGGVNLYAKAIDNIDFMLRHHDKALADQFAHEHARLIKSDRSGQSYRSYSFGDDAKNTVLIDGGLIGDSIIYRRACQYAKTAKKVLYVSQYYPTGKLGNYLRKTRTKFYFNNWRHADSFNKILLRISTIKAGRSTAYKRDSYLHAKFIIFEMPDGEKVAITGSHNFASGGMWLGTREVALETRDPAVIHLLEQFFTSCVG